MLHQQIEHLAQNALKAIYDSWAHTNSVQPFLLLWPKRPLRDISGQVVHIVRFELSGDRSRWSSDMHEAVRATDAQTILLCEQLPDKVLVVLESPTEVTSWELPIEQQNERRVLGKATAHWGKHRVGVLWRGAAISA